STVRSRSSHSVREPRDLVSFRKVIMVVPQSRAAPSRTVLRWKMTSAPRVRARPATVMVIAWKGSAPVVGTRDGGTCMAGSFIAFRVSSVSLVAEDVKPRATATVRRRKRRGVAGDGEPQKRREQEELRRARGGEQA